MDRFQRVSLIHVTEWNLLSDVLHAITLIKWFGGTFCAHPSRKQRKQDNMIDCHSVTDWLASHSCIRALLMLPPNNLHAHSYWGHAVRTHLDLLRPNLQDQVLAKQAIQNDQHDQHAHPKVWKLDKPVTVRTMYRRDNFQ